MNSVTVQQIFRAYDIRGIAMGDNAVLTTDLALAIGKATGTYLLRYGHRNLVCGRDGRLTSEALQQAFIDGVLATGLNVCNIGLAVSPMLYFASCQPEFDCGVNITASHNPKEYNGLKIVGDNAHSICGDELKIIYEMMIATDFVEGSGVYSELDIWPRYRDFLIELVPVGKPISVVADAANGVAGAFLADLFAKMPNVEAKLLYTEVDGNFPNHEANPEDIKNMQAVIEAVGETKAQLGFGFDGDGDRVGMVDRDGTFYSADLLLLVMVRDLLKRKPGSKVVFDVKCSKALENDIIQQGGVPLRSATGHSFIESRMRAEGALIGGEISGHMFFAEDYFGYDDAFLAMLKLIAITADADGDFASLLAGVPKLINTPEIKLACPDGEKFLVVTYLKEYFAKREWELLTIDGVFVSLDDQTWGACRASNTSPNLTLRFEAPTSERLEEVMAVFREALASYPNLRLELK